MHVKGLVRSPDPPAAGWLAGSTYLGFGPLKYGRVSVTKGKVSAGVVTS